MKDDYSDFWDDRDEEVYRWADMYMINEDLWKCSHCLARFHISKAERTNYVYCPKCGYEIDYWEEER